MFARFGERLSFRGFQNFFPDEILILIMEDRFCRDLPDINLLVLSDLVNDISDIILKVWNNLYGSLHCFKFKVFKCEKKNILILVIYLFSGYFFYLMHIHYALLFSKKWVRASVTLLLCKRWGKSWLYHITISYLYPTPFSLVHGIVMLHGLNIKYLKTVKVSRCSRSLLASFFAFKNIFLTKVVFHSCYRKGIGFVILRENSYLL